MSQKENNFVIIFNECCELHNNDDGWMMSLIDWIMINILILGGIVGIIG